MHEALIKVSKPGFVITLFSIASDPSELAIATWLNSTVCFCTNVNLKGTMHYYYVIRYLDIIVTDIKRREHKIHTLLTVSLVIC